MQSFSPVLPLIKNLESGNQECPWVGSSELVPLSEWTCTSF
jgi:hypothetical protein